MKRTLLFLIVCLPMTALAEIKVVASFSILADMVREVTGEHARVSTIVGPNADAHVYSPNVEDALLVAHADVIFVNGLGFETWSNTLIKTSGTKARVFVASDGIEPLVVEDTIDPHAWNSLENARRYVTNIAHAMSDVDPKRSDDYHAKAQRYIGQIQALHDWAVERIAALPVDRRTVVTAHDAFGYLANTYKLEFLAPVGLDTEAEASAHTVARLIDQIKAKRAAALFVENISNPDLVKQIARETGLSVNGRLFSDALSRKGGPATSYLMMFRHNLQSLLTALETKR
ncbi:MAG: zinc ABC transporter substrate-binding protein [Gammaproteobacteria bacterium]|nr:zinc ABC transporter substrate-binding protein [Gammaproteobacteria bacterium]